MLYHPFALGNADDQHSLHGRLHLSIQRIGYGQHPHGLTIVACTSIVYVAYTALLVYGLHADVALCWTADHVYYGCTLTASYLYMRYGNWRARKI